MRASASPAAGAASFAFGGVLRSSASAAWRSIVTPRSQQPHLGDVQGSLRQGMPSLGRNRAAGHDGRVERREHDLGGGEQRRSRAERGHAGQRLAAQRPARRGGQGNRLGPQLAHKQAPARAPHPEPGDRVDGHVPSEVRAQAPGGLGQGTGSPAVSAAAAGRRIRRSHYRHARCRARGAARPAARGRSQLAW